MTQVHPRDDVRAAIVEAAAALLRDHGARAVTTRGVAQAAGVQAPTIYRLFGDKDGLLDAVAEHVMAGYVAGKSVADATGDPVADLRAGWRAHLEFGLANPELYALLIAPGRTAHSPATATGLQVLRTRVRRLAAAGRLRVDEERAVMMIHAAGSGTVLALADTPAEQRDTGLADAVFDAVTRAILTGAPDGTAPDAPAADLRTAVVTLAARVGELPALTAAERDLLDEWLRRTQAHLREHA